MPLWPSRLQVSIYCAKRLALPVRWIALLILLSGGLVACQSEQGPPPTAEPETETVEEPGAGDALETPELEPVPIDEAWLSSLHASSFVVADDGTNSTCARCHAPLNWVPSMDDMPESCTSCKFEVDPAPPFLQEEEWEHIPCKVCHKVKKDEVQEQIAWLEIAQIEEYADVTTTTELCQKCHTEIDLPLHELVVVSEAHADLACTDCHDAHATTATCSTSDCHADLSSIPGHDEDHLMVSCAACHDADGLQVGPDEGQGIWVTFLPESAAAGGEATPHNSHNIQLAAACDRCHYAGNPWDLSESVSSEP